jgi:hypothetical protein
VMSRMRGERPQDYNSRRQLAIQSAIATRAKQLEYEMLRLNGVPLPVVEFPPACTCSLVPFPHVHSAQEKHRFDKMLAPGGKEEARFCRPWPGDRDE